MIKSACGENMENKRSDCEQEFKRIWERLSLGDSRFNNLMDSEKIQDVDIAILKTNMQNLVGSMGKLTGAIWGMTSAIILMLIGFIIWYIQKG